MVLWIPHLRINRNILECKEDMLNQGYVQLPEY